MNIEKNKEKNKQCPVSLSGDANSYYASNSTQNHSNQSFDYWLKKNAYYHQQIIKFYKFVVPQHATVLHINCANGYVLDALNPSWAIGIDPDESCIAQARETYPSYLFYQNIDQLPSHERFDYIILSLATMQTYDIQDLFTSLARFCTPNTRLVIDHYSYVWEPILNITSKLGMRRATRLKNWISMDDLEIFLKLSGYETITQGRYMLMPINIPLVTPLVNTFLVNMPLINRLCLQQWIIAKPIQASIQPETVTVSVIIPCRNEKGNVEQAILRTPQMGKSTEIIFVEGNSQDGTLQEIHAIIAKYPTLNIQSFVQEGKGKGDAVRKGFAQAKGDILMILDGDLTVPPEELSKFFDAIIQGKAEFINGSRLVYGMENEAMRFLNLLANFFFSRLFSWILNQKVKDTLCGTKVLWASDYQKIVNNRSFFGKFDPFGDFDLLFGAAKLNLKIIDMPIHYKNRTYGSTQIRRFYHGWILLGMSLLALKKFKFR